MEVLNSNMLASIAKAVDVAVDRYQNRFKRVVKYKSEGGVKAFNITLIDKIIENFDQFLDPNSTESRFS